MKIQNNKLMTASTIKGGKIAKFFNSISWLYRPVVISLLIAAITWGAKVGNRLSNILESRTFSTVEQRVHAEEFFESLHDLNSPNGRWFDHINDMSVHMPREVKDSIYPTRKDFNDILAKQATNIYYLQQDIRHNRRANDKINHQLELVLKKLEELDNRMNRNGY